MANDNDFVQKRLDALKDDSFQPNAKHARVRMRMNEAPRGRAWKWAAIPVVGILAVVLLGHGAATVAKAQNGSSPALEHLHFFLMAHWNGLVRLVHHSPLFSKGAPETAPPLLKELPMRPAPSESATAFTARPAPAFLIKEPSGKQFLLSELKGKVVVAQFLFTWCGHCQNTAAMLSRLQDEYGASGVQVIGVAFNDEVNSTDRGKNETEVVRFQTAHAKFPVGLSAKSDVLSFLNIGATDAFGVPQVVVIDREGMIQAQTAPRPGPGDLIEEAVLRSRIEELLARK